MVKTSSFANLPLKNEEIPLINANYKFNHVAAAFNAVRTNNLLLLDVLLGPSFPKEKEEHYKLSCEIDAIFDKQLMYEFEYLICMFQIEQLKSFLKSSNRTYQCKELNINLHNALEQATSNQLAALGDRVNERVSYYDSEAAQYILFSEEKNKKLFMQKWQVTFEKIQQKFIREINNVQDAEKLLTERIAEIKVCEKTIADYLHQKKPISTRLAYIDENYSQRKKHQIQSVNRLLKKQNYLPSDYRNRSSEAKDALINAQVSITAKNQWGNTLLHCAVETKNFQIANFLLKRGADITATNKLNQTPADMIGLNDNKRLEILIKEFGDRTLSQFLIDVGNHLIYYRAVVEFRKSSSFLKYIHDPQYLKEREQELKFLEKEYNSTLSELDDTRLANAIVASNPKTGILGRSALHTPLKNYAKNFKSLPGYGLTLNNVVEGLLQVEATQSQEELNKKNKIIQTQKEQLETLQAQISLNQLAAEKKENEYLTEIERLRNENFKLNQVNEKNKEVIAKMSNDNELLLKQMSQLQHDFREQQSITSETKKKLDETTSKVESLEQLVTMLLKANKYDQTLPPDKNKMPNDYPPPFFEKSSISRSITPIDGEQTLASLSQDASKN